MRIIHESHVVSGPSTPPQYGWLEIQRGGTRFPKRSIESPRFLIGAGTNCHVQLGEHVPTLHTLISRTATGWQVEAIAPEPPLTVNEVHCRECRLHDGDVIGIGPYRFRLVEPNGRDAVHPVEVQRLASAR